MCVCVCVCVCAAVCVAVYGCVCVCVSVSVCCFQINFALKFIGCRRDRERGREEIRER